MDTKKKFSTAKLNAGLKNADDVILAAARITHEVAIKGMDAHRETVIRASVDLPEPVHNALKIYLTKHKKFKKIGPFLAHLATKEMGAEFIKKANQ